MSDYDSMVRVAHAGVANEGLSLGKRDETGPQGNTGCSFVMYVRRLSISPYSANIGQVSRAGIGKELISFD